MRSLILAALILPVSLSAFSDDLGPIPESERIALEKLYLSTDGTHWCNHDGWLGARGTECEWHGVSCGFAGDSTQLSYSVNMLYLWENNLVGSLPAELDALTSLEFLHLSGNSISGTVPPGILERWEKGSLIFQGYAEITGLWEISLQYRSSAFCMDFEAKLMSDGSASLSSERCKSGPRMKWQGSRRLGISCESQRGWTDRFGDAFSRLALLLERQGCCGSRAPLLAKHYPRREPDHECSSKWRAQDRDGLCRVGSA